MACHEGEAETSGGGKGERRVEAGKTDRRSTADAGQGRISIRGRGEARRSSEAGEVRPMARRALFERLRLRLRPRWVSRSRWEVMQWISVARN